MPSPTSAHSSRPADKTMSLNSDQYESEGDESYFVSMTDIMVGMLFVFIILLMYFVFRIQNTSEPTVSLSEHRAVIEERDRLKDEIRRLNQNPLEKYLKMADSARESILNALQNSMKNVPGIKEGDVRVIADQGILRLSGDMLFPQGSSTIVANSPSANAVKALSAALAKVLPCFSVGPESNPNEVCNPNAIFIDAAFVEGHTDNVPITGAVEGNIKDNLSLSARRAIKTVQAIYEYQPQLMEMFSISPSQEGLQLGQGSSPLINPAAFGDTRPAFSNATNEGKRSNRRIDLRLLMYSPRTENLDAVRALLGR